MVAVCRAVRLWLLDDRRPVAFVADCANDHILLWPLAPTTTNG
jgi:hypothetical protein